MVINMSTLSNDVVFQYTCPGYEPAPIWSLSNMRCVPGFVVYEYALYSNMRHNAEPPTEVHYNDELMWEEAHRAELEHCMQNICCQTEALLWHLFDEPEKLDNQGSTATDYRCITMRTVSPDEGRSLFDSEDLDFEGESPRCDTDGQDNPPNESRPPRHRLNDGGRGRGNTRSRQWAILRLRTGCQ